MRIWFWSGGNRLCHLEAVETETEPRGVAVSEGVDEPQVFIRHLLICEGVHHDPFFPGRSYSLERIVNWMRPEDEFGFPFVVEQLVLFAQAWGDKGDYEIRIDLFELAAMMNRNV